ncbi:MAG: carboxypeptidase regulatory-like domain-containing protein [Steroidobacteraceae bacterium]|jgi:virginiamycin B lyase|nr:carboxypeptidase regulatory-like domain-containing protein [Steroidobacteraceae bacterium]
MSRRLASLVRCLAAAVAASWLAWPAPVLAAPPGTGSLEGAVTSTSDPTGARIYAHDRERNVRYVVFVVDGRYRAVGLLPGRYEVTVRKPGLALSRPASVSVAAGRTARADLALVAAPAEADYVGGMVYPDARIEPYDTLYPPGPGREVLERTCFGCHTVQLFPYNVVRTYPTGRTPKDRDAWAATVDRMHQSPAFGVAGKPSYFGAKLLPPADRDLLVDYLAKHFPADAPPRVVRKEDGGDPPLDPRALARAMYVEYIFPNTPELPGRFTQQIDFDRNGNVWVTDRGAPGLVELDPRTGRRTDHLGHGGGHGLAVDMDGTVWYSGEVVRRFDPRTGRHDSYLVDGQPAHGSNTQVFDSQGNLWLSLLTTGALGKWDRATDTIRVWDVPIARSRPYGIIVDHRDRVWFAGYHDSGVDMFDPATQKFRHYEVTPHQPTNIRRPGVDSRNIVWVATWGSKGMQNGALYRIDPDSGAVRERRLGIPYANPYTVDADEHDNIWIATDNYLVMYGQQDDRFTYYPLPERTDIPKVTIGAGGAIWFTPRNAGQSGTYGGGASVLYPDMDAVTDLAARFWKGSWANRLSLYQGPPGPAVRGVVKVSPAGFQNGPSPPAPPKGPIVRGKTSIEGRDARRLE